MDVNGLIEECRQEINGIDQDIVQNIVRRMGVVARIADYKKCGELPIVDPKREKEIIDMACDATSILVSEDIRHSMQESMKRIFTTIIEESRKCEISHKFGEEINTSVYVGAPNQESFFGVDKESVFTKLDDFITAAHKDEKNEKQVYVEKVRNAASTLHSLLPQINELFEIHRRLTQAEITIDSSNTSFCRYNYGDKIAIPKGVTVCVKTGTDKTGTDKTFLCNHSDSLLSMDSDGQFYLMTECHTEWFDDNQRTQIRLADFVQDIEQRNIDSSYIHTHDGSLEISYDKKIKDVILAFEKMAADVTLYAQAIVKLFDSVCYQSLADGIK